MNLQVHLPGYVRAAAAQYASNNFEDARCSITLAFLHAFWAMDRADINEISMFNIVVLLFTGEQFLSGDDLALMPDRQRITIILLSIGGVFIFLTCTINVFIAVLCECYDQEQERMEIRKLTWWRWILLLASRQVVVVVFYGVTLFLISEAVYPSLSAVA
ncbi:hypothetical protein AK812_SmicGene15189 [Symbiodinium microadriaticum]|uniref:Uncharacterized protein n=1 Tax=Symbiodinium microadriaticum TaxID=2951 RepID=A0A1Q9E3P6_SYMMI|nr:hypothetical protein AK812_SmicGene15189 [Symbiodinium microadriaticum]